MVRPLPTLSGAALVPRGRRGQSDESAVSALPQDRDGVARDVLDAGPLAARHGGEEAARRIEVVWAAGRSLPRFPLPTARGPAARDRLHPRSRRLPPRGARPPATGG